MELRVIVDKVIAARQTTDPAFDKKTLEKELGLAAGTLSGRLGGYWELHWQVFCKLYPIARDLGIMRLSYAADADHMKRHAEDFGPEFVDAFIDWLRKKGDRISRKKVIDVGKELAAK